MPSFPSTDKGGFFCGLSDYRHENIKIESFFHSLRAVGEDSVHRASRIEHRQLFKSHAAIRQYLIKKVHAITPAAMTRSILYMTANCPGDGARWGILNSRIPSDSPVRVKCA